MTTEEKEEIMKELKEALENDIEENANDSEETDWEFNPELIEQIL